MKNIISIESVEKKYGNDTVIPSINLGIKEGEFVTILGPSGCGKTTLLRMIAGFEKPTSGRIILDGTDITNLEPFKRDMNLVFQHYALFPHMTVEKNITFGLKMKGIKEKEQQERLEEVLRLTQLHEFKNRRPNQLSGGQQQRVAIARAIINNPKVLLLDEPLGALDAKLRKNLQRELKSLQKNLGITFIFVTHDQEEAMSMSDRIIVMNNGKIEQIGTPEEIYQNPKSLFVSTFIGENNVVEKPHGIFTIRPENLNISKENLTEDEHSLIGTVEDFEYLGSLRKIYVRVKKYDTVLVATQSIQKDESFDLGEEVQVYWNESDEVMLG